MTEDEVEPPEGELSDDEMAARLDEAIGRLSEDGEPDGSDEVEIRIEDDEDEEAEDEEPTPQLGDAILLAVGKKAKEADLDTPDPAAEEELEAVERWDPVDDLGEVDLELQATDQPKTHDEIWGDVEDSGDGDLLLVDVEERTTDPWGSIDPAEAPLAEPVRPPPALDLPSPVARLASEPAQRKPPSRSLPWRGVTGLLEPELPELLYVADVAAERSELLVAAWSWDEAEPAGSTLRLRLADDGPELVWSAAAPHEAAIEARLVLDGQSVRTRLAIGLGRDLRGLRLGRDVLADRFQVDPGGDSWPEEQG